MTLRIDLRQVQAVLFGAIGLMVLAMAGFVTMRFGFGNGALFGLGTRLNPLFEASLHAWMGSALLLLSGLLLLLIAASGQAQWLPQFRLQWLLAGTVFIMLSADETAAFHEMSDTAFTMVSGTALSSGWFRLLFGSCALFVIGAMLMSCRAFLAALPASMRNRCLVATAVFLGGAVGMETLGGFWSTAGHGEDAGYYVLAVFEEGMELLGAGLLLSALLRFVADEGVVAFAIESRSVEPALALVSSQPGSGWVPRGAVRRDAGALATVARAGLTAGESHEDDAHRKDAA